MTTPDTQTRTPTQARTRIVLVVAIDTRRGIGIDNKLPWHLPEDLAHFKRLTSGHTIIMGRKTFESIGRPLPKRRNVVVTRNPDWRHDGVEAVTSLDAALALVRGQDQGQGRGQGQAAAESAFIIGGAQIFAESMALADAMVITEIDQAFECDTFFPALDAGAWREDAREQHHSEQAGLDYAIVSYVRADAAADGPARSAMQPAA